MDMSHIYHSGFHIYVNFLFEILIFRFKNNASKGDVFSFFNSRTGGYISCKAFSNSPPSFMAVKSLIKRKKLPIFWTITSSFLFFFPNPLIFQVIEE